jgi:hypothetical protein
LNSLFVLLITFAASSAEPVLARVPELQETAHKANRGHLGCGSGSMTLVTSHGEITFDAGLDPIHVFGPRADASDLIALLQSRAESNRGRTGGPMSGKVSDLCFVCLKTLADAGETAAIPVMAELTADSDEVVRRWANLSLTRLLKAEPQMQSVATNAMVAAQVAASQRRMQKRMGIGAAAVLAFGVLGIVAYKRSRARRQNCLAT